MNLTRKDYEFHNPIICQAFPKHMDLDRVLINLYMLLKYEGRRTAMRAGRREVRVPDIVSQLTELHGEKLKGFRDYPEIVENWVHSDLLDIVYRGLPDKEKVAAPLPLHLNAYKLRNPKQSNDYRGSEHIYSLIKAGDPDLLHRLKEFLGQGMDRSAGYDKYDEETHLDLDTLAIVRMVDNPALNEKPGGDSQNIDPPLCIGHAKLLCNDLRRLLAYEKYVPRSVMIGYIRTAIGFHMGLHLLRLFQQVAGWVKDKEAHSACLNCPVQVNDPRPFLKCPYAFQNLEDSRSGKVSEIIVDMGENHSTRMAQIAMDNCATAYDSMYEYIQSVFTINQLFQYTQSHAYSRAANTPAPKSVSEILKLLKQPSQAMDAYFTNRIDAILPEGPDAERAEVKAIYEIKDLRPIETFVELISLERTYNYRRELTRQLDAVFMKNTDSGLMRQGKGAKNRRRWYMGSRMLEFLVQIAVLEQVGQGPASRFISKPILIDDFISWMKERYGLVVMPEWTHASIEDNQAFNENLKNLKRRLREIGFYTDLSDAYNTQTIRPRYQIEKS